uniref:FA core complex associated protein 24 n=1 Tax=Erpetoichthys calabaricus TaxID=27687 RepID=A0A8C4TR94_ERPCA
MFLQYLFLTLLIVHYCMAQYLMHKKPIFEDGLDSLDFHLPNQTCVLYISETDVVIGNNYKRKLVRFRNATKLYGIVLTEKTRLSDQYFPFVQKFVVLELGMPLFPIANQAEASGFLIQWVSFAFNFSVRMPLIKLNQLTFVSKAKIGEE